MSGTRSPSRTAPAIDGWRLRLILAPFVWAAVAINLFMLALIGRALGWPSLSPWTAMLVALPLTVPAGWLAGRWVGGLLARAGQD